ncbi:MAG: TIGR00153 family protein [Pseudomonadales bacterium]|nr:TIGR00153 family protein [Pseudomonadales bacterium]
MEKQADKLKKEVRLHLPTGLLLSVSRNDLLELIRAQDKIANVARDLAGLACGRAMNVPAALAEEFRRCVEQSISTVNALNDTLHNLDTLVGTGFIQSRTRAIEAGVDLVDDRERESDHQESVLRGHLFELEHGMDPVEVMFLYQLIDLLGEVADRAQVVANRIRIILAN